MVPAPAAEVKHLPIRAFAVLVYKPMKMRLRYNSQTTIPQNTT